MGVPQSRPPVARVPDVAVSVLAPYSRLGARAHFAEDPECPSGVGHFGAAVP